MTGAIHSLLDLAPAGRSAGRASRRVSRYIDIDTERKALPGSVAVMRRDGIAQ